MDAMNKRLKSPYVTSNVKPDTPRGYKPSVSPHLDELEVPHRLEEEEEEEDEEDVDDVEPTDDEEAIDCSSDQQKYNTMARTSYRSEFSPVWNVVFSKGYYPTVQLDELGNAMIYVANASAKTTITANREQNAIHFEFCWNPPEWDLISMEHEGIQWVVKDKVKTELSAKPHLPQRMEFAIHLPSNYSAPHLKIIPNPRYAIIYLQRLADFSHFTTVFTLEPIITEGEKIPQ